MGRRAGSVAALIVAALLVGAGPGLWGASIAGSATRAPAPTPPPVGTCGTLVDAVFRSVPCEAPHDVEVTETLPASTPSIPRQLRYAECRDRALEYVGSAPAGQPAATPVGQWTLPLRYGHAAVTGPSDVEIEGWSWRACVVRPLAPPPGGGYRGSVRQTEPDRPTALRPCYESADDIGVVTACTQPHAVEVLAVQAVPRRGVAEPARDLLRSCVATARAATGAPDPTFGGRLAMRVLPDEGAPPVALSADVGAFYTSDGALDWRLCIVQAAQGFVLTETVAGVGSGPLPITGS